MGLLDAIVAGVKVADKVTKDIQATVLFRHYTGEDGFGQQTYKPAIGLPALQLRAIVDWKQKQVRTLAGTLSVSRAYVGFLDYAALNAATNGEGVNDSDMIELPDGTTGPILDMSGFISPATGHGVITEVWLG